MSRRKELQEVAMNAMLKGNRGPGRAYLSDNKTSDNPKEIRAQLFRGMSVDCPNANQHHFADFYKDVAGFEDVSVMDWTSSAGDWSFGVKIDGLWYLAWQENRFPRHGFRYYVADGGWSTFNELVNQRGSKF